VLVSTGGFIEYVLTQGKQAVEKYIDACKELEFDIIEISAGFITIPTDDWLRLIERVQKGGLKAKPEVGIQFGAGGDTPQEALQEEGIIDPEVNLFVDHSQIVQLEALRQGIWGTKSLWGRVLTYKG
jgi:phosphosulfolactate synthase (CoM biosynthesis protein A)